MKLSQILLSTPPIAQSIAKPIAVIALALTTLSGCAVQGHPAAQRQAAARQTTPKPTAKAQTKQSAKHQAKKKEELPAPPKTLRVRTTAYTSKRNAIGTPVSHGPVISAASDWSRFPLGTRFKVRQTGKTYVIDDYGSALVGTNTIDLAKRNKGIVNAWGVRWVDIDILEWGSSRRSLEVLAPRQQVRHVKPMLKALKEQSTGMPSEFHRMPL